MSEEDSIEKKKRKKNASSKYNYSFGDVYPGNSIGHKHSFQNLCYPVPSDMGWLWNIPDPIVQMPKRKWQPGVITKNLSKVMSFKVPRVSYDKDRFKKKKQRKKKTVNNGDDEPEEVLEPKPTLKVQRKGDVFTIQVNPLKDLSELGPNEYPYVDCDPMVFKIIKKRSPEEQAKVEAKKMIKLKKERDAEIRKALAEAAEDICKCAYMDVFCNDLTGIDKVIEKCPAFEEPPCICKDESLSSLSSNATWDIEYTPPFGCFDLTAAKRQNFIHVETQYVPADAGVVESPKSKKSSPSVKSKRRTKK
ncbi:uncharacterized protein LOC121726342 isoform X2 [Aricia agestis]|uniref:uncharacterized protein LOC121726342 isoform X2 n=1 Tax=Aricia agestis TaxID=91739 RepID=UPI001C204953|nr:uncharacterized protein LOC121726342 isoform X2 [Aricia agestis]